MEEPAKARLGRRGWLAVALVAASYTAALTYLSLLRHEYFHSATYDLGLFDNLIYNMGHGRFFESSIKGFNYLGDHFSPILALLAPLYWIWDDVRCLLVFQPLIVAVSAFPFAAIAAETTGSAAAGVALSAVFLLHPNIWYTTLFDFHPEILLVPVFTSALFFMKRNRPWIAVAFSILAMTVKEDVAITSACFGIYLFFTRSKRAGAFLATFSTVWFFAVMLWVMPALKPAGSHGGYLYLERYSHLGGSIPEIIKNFILHPVHAVVTPYHEWKGVSFLRMFFTAGFLPFAGFPLLLVAAPSMLINFSTSYLSQFDVRFQYQTVAVPFILFAMLDGFAVMLPLIGKAARSLGIKRAGKKEVTAFICAVLVGMSCFTFVWIKRTMGIYGSFNPPKNAPQISEAIAMIPPDATVASLNLIGPHLSHRRHYQFAVPFEPHWYHYEKLKLPLYSDAEYQLFTFDETRWTMDKLWPRITELKYTLGYETLYEKNEVLLLRKPARPR